jgi:hypothetical protein
MIVYRDNVRGSAYYGTYNKDPLYSGTFSTYYAPYVTSSTKFLFINGNQTAWLQTTYLQMVGPDSSYVNVNSGALRTIVVSSISGTQC